MRPPSNSYRDWPFLRPPERVPEVPVVSREHLPKLEKIQEVLPCRPDERPKYWRFSFLKSVLTMNIQG